MKRNKILISGACGQLGMAFQKFFDEQGVTYCALAKEDFDIADFKQAQEIVEKEKPTILINCAAYNQVDEAEKNPDKAFLVNTQGVKNLSLLCKKHNIFFVHYSTDYVFDGTKGQPYSEDDTPNPINQYAKSKLEGENVVKKELKNYLILRVSWVFGEGKQNFLYKLNNWSQEKDVLRIADDEISVPTYTEDIVKGTFLTLNKNLSGLYHMPSSGFCSRYQWAKFFFERMNTDVKIKSVSRKSFDLLAKRPEFSAMSNSRLIKILGCSIPSWESGVERFVQDLARKGV